MVCPGAVKKDRSLERESIWVSRPMYLSDCWMLVIRPQPWPRFGAAASHSLRSWASRATPTTVSSTSAEVAALSLRCIIAWVNWVTGKDWPKSLTPSQTALSKPGGLRSSMYQGAPVPSPLV